MSKSMYGKVIVLSLLVLMISPALPVIAQDGEEVVAENGDVDTVGILPTNPFYFLKEWGRGLRRAFIFDPVKRAEFELGIAEEKADELEEVSGLGSDEDALGRATLNYEEAIERLRARLEKLGEESNNPRVEELLNMLAERAAAHQELMENLRSRHEQLHQFQERLEHARAALDGTIEFAGRSLESLERVRERIESIIEERGENEGLIRVLGVIESIRLRIQERHDAENSDENESEEKNDEDSDEDELEVEEEPIRPRRPLEGPIFEFPDWGERIRMHLDGRSEDQENDESST